MRVLATWLLLGHVANGHAAEGLCTVYMGANWPSAATNNLMVALHQEAPPPHLKSRVTCFGHACAHVHNEDAVSCCDCVQSNGCTGVGIGWTAAQVDQEFQGGGAVKLAQGSTQNLVLV